MLRIPFLPSLFLFSNIIVQTICMQYTQESVEKEFQALQQRINGMPADSEFRLFDDVKRTFNSIRKSMLDKKLDNTSLHYKIAACSVDLDLAINFLKNNPWMAETSDEQESQPDLQSKPEPKKKKYIPQQSRWRSIIPYLFGTGLFTTIGLYSYYKLPTNVWYRPLLFGFSIVGGSACTLFGINSFFYKKKLST